VADPPLNQVVSRTIEAGLRGRFKPSADGAALSWNLGLFRTGNSDDIINVASPIPNRGYFVNGGDTRRQGVEAQIEYDDARWSAHAGYGFLDATFQSRLAISSPFNPVADADGIVRVTPGDELTSTPRHRFKAGVDYALTPKWKTGAELIAVGSQYLEGDVSNRNPAIPPLLHCERAHVVRGDAKLRAVRPHPESLRPALLCLRRVLRRRVNTVSPSIGSAHTHSRITTRCLRRRADQVAEVLRARGRIAKSSKAAHCYGPDFGGIESYEEISFFHFRGRCCRVVFRCRGHRRSRGRLR
jgi:hypothetical protein